MWPGMIFWRLKWVKRYNILEAAWQHDSAGFHKYAQTQDIKGSKVSLMTAVCTFDQIWWTWWAAHKQIGKNTCLNTWNSKILQMPPMLNRFKSGSFLILPRPNHYVWRKLFWGIILVSSLICIQYICIHTRTYTELYCMYLLHRYTHTLGNWLQKIKQSQKSENTMNPWGESHLQHSKNSLYLGASYISCICLSIRLIIYPSIRLSIKYI